MALRDTEIFSHDSTSVAQKDVLFKWFEKAKKETCWVQSGR